MWPITNDASQAVNLFVPFLAAFILLSVLAAIGIAILYYLKVIRNRIEEEESSR